MWSRDFQFDLSCWSDHYLSKMPSHRQLALLLKSKVDKVINNIGQLAPTKKKLKT
jgi:hypothetical protein